MCVCVCLSKCVCWALKVKERLCLQHCTLLPFSGSSFFVPLPVVLEPGTEPLCTGKCSSAQLCSSQFWGPTQQHSEAALSSVLRVPCDVGGSHSWSPSYRPVFPPTLGEESRPWRLPYSPGHLAGKIWHPTSSKVPPRGSVSFLPVRLPSPLCALWPEQAQPGSHIPRFPKATAGSPPTHIL